MVSLPAGQETLLPFYSSDKTLRLMQLIAEVHGITAMLSCVLGLETKGHEVKCMGVGEKGCTPCLAASLILNRSGGTGT